MRSKRRGNEERETGGGEEIEEIKGKRGKKSYMEGGRDRGTRRLHF